MVDVIRCTPDVAEPIATYAAHGVSSARLAAGTGESHAYVLHFEPGGELGEHRAGFDQRFLVVAGTAWLTVDGETIELETGEAGAVPYGSMHAKGSRRGATVVMVQATDIAAPDETDRSG